MTLDDIARGMDLAESEALVHRGLDLSKPQEMTTDEAEAFKTHYAAQFGHAHRGLDFWLEQGPKGEEILKRYRLYAGISLPVKARPGLGHGYIAWYALLGYTTGVRYCIYSAQHGSGLSKSLILEQLAVAFIHAGPRGMETIVDALDGYEWFEPPQPITFTPPYTPDPEAFASGLDFSSPELSLAELERLEAWYLTYLGEVPRYVRFLGKHRPALLKAYRNRYEHCLRELPKQYMPTSLLYFNVLRGSPEGVRENVLLCKGFGVTKADTVATITNALVYPGMEGAALVDEAAGDVLDAWT